VRALSGRLVIGPWNAPEEPFMGPLISVRAAEGAKRKAAQLVERGARAIKAPETLELGPAYLSPGLIDVTGVGAPDEEIFAPVLQVIRVPTFEAAIEAANDTRYGLAAGLVSEDEDLWRRFINRSRAGVVNWNRPTPGAASDMPFGGVGASGNHRPSAYYAADYCAYPVASFEAKKPSFAPGEVKGLRASEPQ
jgi:succinylglutamic semialdehyde dehydrogenase